MIPNFPSSVEIGGQSFEIVWKDLEEWGSMEFDARKIHICPSRCLNNPSGAWATLRHEMLHASLCMGGVAYAEKYDDEVVVRCIENLFFPAWDKINQTNQ